MRQLLVVLALFLVLPARAQTPDAEWRTLETPSFRVHYPAPWEDWARSIASRLEPIRTRVATSVGYDIPDRIDVLVMDPAGVANGSAWPFIGAPRMIFWTNPPGPESGLGYYSDWGELLAIHEQTHLAHILRPSRNPWTRARARLIPIGPIAFAPRWVSEGYATVLEGELTGFGRPNGDLRAAVLRRWAQQGRLPNYAQLHSDTQNWLGMSMAYLAGSAYLEWLSERAGSESLQHLWARMTARKSRSFDDAFTGVFGDSPRVLYARFTAEITRKAMFAEESLKGTLREGELWQDFSRSTEPPSLSPDGSMLVTVLRKQRGPARLVILPTGDEETEEKEYQEKIAKMLARDPQDVAPIRSRPLTRKPLHTLETVSDPRGPRWSPDGRSVVFVRFEPDTRGVFHPDLFRWTFAEERVERLTHGADVREPDPSPDGERVIAVRNRYGKSQLVSINLATGGIEEVTPASIDTVYSSPRWSSDGSQIVYVKHTASRWSLVVRDMNRGVERALDVSGSSTIAQPAWSHDDRSVYAVAAIGGSIEIGRIDADGTGTWHQLTRTNGASLAPEPSPDGTSLYFLGLDADGLDLRHLVVAEALEPLEPMALDPSMAPITRKPAPLGVQPIESSQLEPSKPYGIGKQEWMVLLGGNVTPSNQNLEIGARLGDVVGRLDTIMLAAIGSDGNEQGAAIVSSWRGWPVELTLHMFDADQTVTHQPEPVPGASTDLDLQRNGVELALGWSSRRRDGRAGTRVGSYFGSVQPNGGRRDTQRIFFAEIEARQMFRSGKFRFETGVEGRADVGDTGGDSWTRGRGTLRLGGIVANNGLRAAWTFGESNGVEGASDRFAVGGLRSSILPSSPISNRVLSAALPIGSTTGERYEGFRGELVTSLLPFVLFGERHRTWNETGTARQEIGLIGAEIRMAFEAMPLVRFPGGELTVGAARVLDAPFEDETFWWLGLAWRP